MSLKERDLDDKTKRLKEGTKSELIVVEAYNLVHPDNPLVPLTAEDIAKGYSQVTGVDYKTKNGDKFVDIKSFASFDFLQIEDRKIGGKRVWKISMPNPIRFGNMATHIIITHPFLNGPYVEYTIEEYILRFFVSLATYEQVRLFISQWDQKIMEKEEYLTYRPMIEEYLKDRIKPNFIVIEKNHSDSIRFGIKYNYIK